jgi:predicted nucleic acid-binding protein
MIISDITIDALTGRKEVRRTIEMLFARRIGISIATVIEVSEGAFRSPNPVAHLTAFARFLVPFDLLMLFEPIAEHCGEIRAHPRRRGQPNSDFDAVIAATALHYSLTLLTFNRRHFERIPDLRLYEFS